MLLAGDHIMQFGSEGPAGQLAELAEEGEDGIPAPLLAREPVAPADVPDRILGDDVGKPFDIAAVEELVAPADDGGLLLHADHDRLRYGLAHYIHDRAASCQS